MIFTIRKGRHYSRPFRFAVWWNRKVFTRKVVFANNCKYDLSDGDELDTNKLFGVGYIPGFHHKDSARFGWRYIPTLQQVELLAYCYVDGVRIIQPLCMCDIGKEYELQLHDFFRNYIFRVINEQRERIADYSQVHAHKKKLQYRLGVYFGGNQVAPHEMKIELKKLG